MDVGSSLNPAIDIGQIEGAFAQVCLYIIFSKISCAYRSIKSTHISLLKRIVLVQGYGLYTLEEMKFSPDGYVLTRGPGTYKLPGFGDIPVEFNVTLLKSSTNPRAVYSSKVRRHI